MEPRRPEATRGAPGSRSIAAVGVVLAIVAACGPATPAATSAPSAVASAPPTVAISPSAAATAGACIDVALLADTGDPAENAIQLVDNALAAHNVADARTAAAQAAAGIRKLASFVGDASPAANTQLLLAADELDQAAAAFPGGADLLAKAKADLDGGFNTARASACQ